jgi:DDE family transposase
MRVSVETEQLLAAKFEAVFPHLDERQRRLLMGAEAQALGHGGIAVVARAAGVAATTVSRGVSDLDSGAGPLGRTRRPGGGRKRLAQTDPGLRVALLALVEPDERGDPESPLRWTTKSTRRLAAELTASGRPVSADTVGDLLRAEGFSLQGNAKTVEGKQHPDRDGQFRYINEQARAYQAAGDPVISVDTKKKELVGPYANDGQQWRPAGQPAQVRTHDFPDPQLGKAIPYGIYDVAANTGWVNVGTDHDTAAFAVESIRRWWSTHGRHTYPNTRRLLITADAGGSNSYRTRAWKAELAAFAIQTGLDVTVSHFPPGTSKWNKVEHRLFAHISMNWQGRPLTSHDVIINTIAGTTTGTGLRVQAHLDTGTYPTGQNITDQHMATLALTRHDWHGDWNYTLHPHPATTDHTNPPAAPTPAHPTPVLAELAHPAITGMTTTAFTDLLDRLDLPRQAQREADLYTERGHPRRPNTAGGRPPRITLTDRLIATILKHRFGLPATAIAELLHIHYQTAARAINRTHRLLTQLRHPIPPAHTPLTTLNDLANHATTAGLDITNIK